MRASRACGHRSTRTHADVRGPPLEGAPGRTKRPRAHRSEAAARAPAIRGAPTLPPVPRPRPRTLLLLALSLALPPAPAIADDTPAADTSTSGPISPSTSTSGPGARTWERCAVCHGADGAGRPDGTFPKIAGQHASVVRAQLEAIRAGERPNPVMQPHVEPLADVRDLVDVAAFVAAMPRDPVCHVGPGDDLERGARLYRERCASCHGAAGEGDAEEGVPWLACQHHAYLLRRARQLASWGRNAHPETSPPLARMTDAELRAAMDYAARLSGVVAEAAPAATEPAD